MLTMTSSPTSPRASPIPSPLLLPHSPRSRQQPAPFHTTRTSRKTPDSPAAKILPSTSAISLLSLSFSKAAVQSEEDAGMHSISSVLEEACTNSTSSTPVQSPKPNMQNLYRKTPASTSYTNTAGLYFNSAQHRRVSHYISAGSPTTGSAIGSMSRRSSVVNLAGSPRSRRPSYAAIPPDSPSLGPISLGSSPTKMFLAQTPPSLSMLNPSSLQQLQQQQQQQPQQQQQLYSHQNTWQARTTPISIPGKSESHGQREPGSPVLGPVMTPLEAAPMTPMVLDASLSYGMGSQRQQNGFYVPKRMDEEDEEEDEEENAGSRERQEGSNIIETLKKATN